MMLIFCSSIAQYDVTQETQYNMKFNDSYTYIHLYSHCYRLSNIKDVFEYLQGRIHSYWEYSRDCECSFEVDEDDCPTQPGGS